MTYDSERYDMEQQQRDELVKLMNEVPVYLVACALADVAESWRDYTYDSNNPCRDEWKVSTCFDDASANLHKASDIINEE